MNLVGNMKIDGVWKVEMRGPWGWEARATAFLENGTFRGASTDHFTIGTYSIDGVGEAVPKALRVSNMTSATWECWAQQDSNLRPADYEGW